MVDEDHSNRAVVSDLREAVLDAKVHNRNMDRVFELLRQFHQNSIDEAVKILGFSTRSHISECCSKKTKRKTAYGYIWEYAPEFLTITK